MQLNWTKSSFNIEVSFIPFAGLVALLWLGLAASLVFVGQAEPEAKARAQQVVKNPFFKQWSAVGPEGWTVEPGVKVSKDEDGFNSRGTGLVGDCAKLTNPPPGRGIYQDVVVQPNELYVLSGYVKVEGEGHAILRVDGKDGKFYTGVRFPPYEYYWHEAVDVRPVLPPRSRRGLSEGKTTVRISILRDPADKPDAPCTIRVDNITLSTLHPVTRHAKLRLPTPRLLMYGFHEEQAARWDEVFKIFNIFGGEFRDASRIQRLEETGAVCAQRVHHPYYSPMHIHADGTSIGRDRLWNTTTDGLLASLAWPFVETLEGTLPDGFKAIMWDEMQGHPNGSEISRVHVQALAQLRRRFPNKLVIVWGTNDLAETWPTKGGPFADYERAFANAMAVNSVGGRIPKPDPKDRPRYPDCWEVVRAIRDYADLYLQECYLFESRPEFLAWPELMCANLDTLAPGILQKTILGLIICDSVCYRSSNSPNVLYKEFLDEQLHRIRHSPTSSRTNGVAFFALYRAEYDTLNHVCELVRHYFLQERRNYYGWGYYKNPVSDPSFEAWPAFISPGLTVVEYGPDTTPNPWGEPFPTYQLQAGHRLLRMGAEGRPHFFPQRVSVRAPGWYTLSAWFTSKGQEPLRLSAYALDGHAKKLLGTRDVRPFWPNRWTLGTMTFYVPVPEGARKYGDISFADIEIVLSDAAVQSPVDLYVDCVELEPTWGINRPTVIREAHPQPVKAGTILTLRGENFKPAMFVYFGDRRSGYAQWVNPSTVKVQVPKDLPAAAYDLTLLPRQWTTDAETEKAKIQVVVEDS